MTFMQLEIMKNQAITIKSSNEALTHIGLDHKEVDTCVENSFVEPGNYQSENLLLKEDRKWQSIMEITSHPTISINNHTYHGNFIGKDIAIALCASFKERPDECKNNQFLSKIGTDKDYDNFDEDFIDHTERNLIIGAVSILLVNVCLIQQYRKSQKKQVSKEIRNEVNMAVAQYFALRGE